MLIVVWSAKRQLTLSRSSIEVEYTDVANVAFESCWLRNLLLELHCLVMKATLVYYGDGNAVYLSKHLVQHQRTKHIKMVSSSKINWVTYYQIFVIEPLTIYIRALSSIVLDVNDVLRVSHWPIDNLNMCFISVGILTSQTLFIRM